jgi:hypothetical protein
MAQWNAPFADPTAQNGPVWGAMSGIWVGKKN